MKLKQKVLQSRNINEKINTTSSKLECPYCQEKDLNQFVRVGEGNTKCMSCCNYFD